QRVEAARACGPRVALSGESLPPLRPHLSDAQSSGELSAEHTKVILTALHALPAAVGAEDCALAEKHLVEAATILRPREVGLLGHRLLAHLHPDGTLAPDSEQQRRRNFSLLPNTDGSYTAAGRLTPACGAQLLAWLSPRSAPAPSDETGPDPRSPGQRMHDALEQLAGLAIRRTELVESGAPAQVIISMTADQLSSRRGLVETSFGQLLPVEDALRMADEASLHLLLRDQHGAVLKHGRTRRIATRTQSLALTARDQGCTFPGCDHPPEHCQRHHIVGWADGGTTDLDNLTLLCTFHHREFERGGWSCQMIDGQPHWIPPAWIDPERTPRRNHRISRQ
ncbi:HNH endonuclease signature motif containing protein, partial [Jatrophihabitans sp.]|uniref:HNH endonuclease signature motif containing protein n=1 Tax=Jatrophihabitans sp. TaxID=1932789 RepID=UPI002EFE340C